MLTVRYDADRGSQGEGDVSGGSNGSGLERIRQRDGDDGLDQQPDDGETGECSHGVVA